MYIHIVHIHISPQTCVYIHTSAHKSVEHSFLCCTHTAESCQVRKQAQGRQKKEIHRERETDRHRHTHTHIFTHDTEICAEQHEAELPPKIVLHSCQVFLDFSPRCLLRMHASHFI